MEEAREGGVGSRAAKRQKPGDYEQGDDVDAMLMQQIAQEMWDWPQDEAFTNEYVHHVHPCIDSVLVAFNNDMAELPAVVEPKSSMLVSLVVDKHGFTTLVRPDHHSRMQLKIGLANSLGVGHIVPPVSVVHAFIFVNKQSKELQLSMFDVSCLRGEELCMQKRRDRNRVLHDLVKEAWHTHQIAAVHRLVDMLETKDEPMRAVGDDIAGLCNEFNYDHRLLEDIALCRAGSMPSLPSSFWENQPEMQHVRFPGQLSLNLHWQQVMTVQEAMAIDRDKYQAPGSPSFHSVLLLPEVDEMDRMKNLCRRLM